MSRSNYLVIFLAFSAAAFMVSCNGDGDGGGEDGDAENDVLEEDITADDDLIDTPVDDVGDVGVEDMPDDIAEDIEPETELPPPPGLEKNGRWLTYNGIPIFLVGVDAQSIACNTELSYTDFLDLLVSNRNNKIRIWIYCSFGTVGGLLIPWKEEADGKHNLDEWNEDYWTRIRGFISEARDRGVIVEASIFHSNYIERADRWSSDRYRLVWNRDFNVNEAFSANAGGHFYPEFYDLDLPEVSSTGKTLQDYQQALIDKTLAELGEFENVYFEVSNEFLFPSTQADVDANYGWQQHWASYIKEQVPNRLVAVQAHAGSGDHTRGINYWWDEPYIDIMNFHLYEYNPDRISQVLHEAQSHSKVLITNESGDIYDTDGNIVRGRLNDSTRYAYGMLTSGGYFAQYLEDRFLGATDWVVSIERLSIMRDIAERLDWWLMSPVDDGKNEYDSLVGQGPADGWQVLANPGADYLVYFWGATQDRDALVDLPAGSYSYEWYDCEDGEMLLDGTVDGGDGMSIPAPSSSDWNGDIGLALIIMGG